MLGREIILFYEDTKVQEYISFACLGKVAHNVEAFEVIICHYVEEERICVVIQGFVVQETLGQ